MHAFIMPSRQSQQSDGRSTAPSRVMLSQNPDIRTLEDFLGGGGRSTNRQPSDRRRRSSRERSSRSRRQHRRITGYHNVFDELSPPDYDVFGSLSEEAATAEPPDYECTVEAEDVMEVIWERNSPFQPPQMNPWQTVHVELRGTLLQISNAKTHGLLAPAGKRGMPTGEAGRRIRSYTLQHAEVGLASDHKKVEMIPKSPIAQLLPDTALKQLQESDPSQFDIVYNYIARVRVESEQVLLRFRDSEQRSSWVDKICAAIDIAMPLECRSEPRNHTLPRRRRRHEGHRIEIRTTTTGQGVVSASLVAEQERILREHYPHLIQTVRPDNQQPQESEPRSPRERHNGTEGADGENDGEDENDNVNDNEPEQEPDPDYGDLDLAFMRDPTAGNDPDDDDDPPRATENLTYNGNDSNSSSHHGSPNVDSVGDLWTEIRLTRVPQSARNRTDRKWHPRVPRNDALRDARYRRRCMPMLVHNSRYATNVIIHKGKRKVIDWNNKKLVPWPASPPSYHDVLYGPAKTDPAKPGEDGEAEAQRRAGENLPPGAGNAVMRLRGLLRRHASSGEMEVNPLVSASGQSSNHRRQRQRKGTPSAPRSSGDGADTAQVDTNTSAPSNAESADSTPSATTVNSNTTAECSSSGDDQSVSSPALNFMDPNVNTKASNSTAFSKKLKQRFGRRAVSETTNAQMDEMESTATRDGTREEDYDGFSKARLERLRTASSFDMRRAGL